MYSFVIDRSLFGQVLFVLLKFDILNLIDDIIFGIKPFIAREFNIYLPKLKHNPILFNIFWLKH